MARVPTRDELKALAGGLREALSGLDPDWVTPVEAVGLWSELEAIRRMVSGAQLVLARRVDESSVAAEAGLRSGAEWMAKASGASLRSGYDQTAASRRLTDLPRLAAAAARGDVSVSQAGAIADAATADPAAEDRLLAHAGGRDRQTRDGPTRPPPPPRQPDLHPHRKRRQPTAA